MKRVPYISIILLFSIFLFSFILPYFYNISPYKIDSNSILLPPSAEHIFGTDRLGRDLFARLMQGGQVSLTIGVVSAFIASFMGLIIGISAGFLRALWIKV